MRRRKVLLVPCMTCAVLALALVGWSAGCGGQAPSSAADTVGVEAIVTDLTTETANPAADAQSRSLLVAAAGGLKNAFTEIAAAFDESNDAATTLNLAAAGQLRKQIEGGAPADVFASSDPKQMQALVDAGLVDVATVQTFAYNEIVLIVPVGSSLGVTSFEDLAKDEVRKVSTADPQITPLGVATLEILPKLGILDQVEPKLVYTQTVNQTLDYVSRDEVDAGIVWKSEAQAGGDQVRVVAQAEKDWHDEIRFVIGIVDDSEAAGLGQEFIDFVLGAEGQTILQKHGFLAVQG